MKEKFPGHGKLLGFVAGASIALGPGCGENTTSIKQTPQEDTPATLVATPRPSEVPGTPRPSWYLTGGPHSDGLSKGEKYAIDIAAAEVVACPEGKPLTQSPFPSPAEGQVVTVGDETNPADPNHSIVVIKMVNGEHVGLMHLANIKVKAGDTVMPGDLLGDPSCENPPGGRTEGIHVHLFMQDKNGNPISVDGLITNQGVVRKADENYQGTLEKAGEKTLTADRRRCDADEKCGGIRNDLNGFFQIFPSPQRNGLVFELRYADGSPVVGPAVELYAEEKDINGNPIPKGRAEQRENLEAKGFVEFDAAPGRYVILFDGYGNTMAGNNLTKGVIKPGVADIEVRPNEVTTKQMTLGRIVVNFREDEDYLFKGSGADACVDGRDKATGERYKIICVEENDQNKSILNLLPGEYILRYIFRTNFFYEETVDIENMNISQGQIIEFTCLEYATKDREKAQAKCD